MKRSLLFISILLFAVAACKKSEDETPAPAFILECIEMRDDNASVIGTYGDCAGDQDWTGLSLSTTEMEFLDFATTQSVTGIDQVVVNSTYVFPNPVPAGDDLRFGFFAGDPSQTAHVKFAIINEIGDVLLQTDVLLKGQEIVALDVSGSDFPTGNYYRLYYSFSAEGNPDYYQGYGDFIHCPGMFADPADCF